MSSTETDIMFAVTSVLNSTHDQTPRESFDSVTSSPVRYFVIVDLLLIINVLSAISFSVTVFGILSNICNIVVFVGLGVLETATSVTLFALSVSDLLFLLILFVFWTFRFLNNLGVSQTTQGIPITYFVYQFLQYFRMAYTLSELFTVYLAVQKCCCVALPFRFKLIFTPYKSLATLSIIVIAVFAFYAPLFFSMGLQQVVDLTQNTTRYIPWFSEDREVIVSTVFHTIMNLLVPTAGQVIVAVCLVVLTQKLRETTKFRQASEMLEPKVEGSKVKKSKVKDSSKLSGKELRAVQSVVVLVVMFIVCNLPTVLTQYATYIEPEFDDFRRYSAIYSLECSSWCAARLSTSSFTSSSTPVTDNSYRWVGLIVNYDVLPVYYGAHCVNQILLHEGNTRDDFTRPRLK
ncbi:uncharacterized protein LOC101847008 [Aplysia californica]|uniref:Uncharacterized protein LOC101847008 n=1 Tax=Aplysia californica TaxID=6500 RepID=A0ABM0K9Q4_APLCA|nr:uncharacterized protein LOC101847008 [Aplysia californica]